MRIANPFNNRPFERIDKDKNGNEEYGYRIVDGIEEIVHLPTGRSNMTYYEPEKVTHFDGCNHEFRIINIGLREVECRLCEYQTLFHPAINFKEVEGKAYITLKNTDYPVI